MKKKQFYIDLLGCEKRKLDAEKIIKFFKANNYEHSKNKGNIKNVDTVIFVSCAFNDEFTELSKEKIKSLLKEKSKDAKFILSGCLTDIHQDFLIDNNIKNFAGPRELSKINSFINHEISIDEIPEQNISFFDNKKYPIPDTEYRSELLKEYVNAKNAYKIRVTWGCLSNCSYCAVKKATKKLKSKPLCEIQKEIDTGLSLGYKDFFITGGDVGAYGVDISVNITHLIELLTSRKDINLFIQEFNVQWLIKHSKNLGKILLKNINNYNKLFINIPIQSGSNIVLKKMRRSYKSEDIFKAISEIRYCNHKIKIGSHFIVGFPTETENEYLKTKDLISKLRLDFNMIFTYSDKSQNKIYSKEDIIPLETANKRRYELLTIQKNIDIEENKYLDINKVNINRLNIFKTVEGWLTEKEAELLYNTAKISSGNIVEIGAWKGLSTIFLSLGLIQGKNDNKIYSIDHHTGSKEHQKKNCEIFTLPEFSENIRKFNVGHVIRTVVTTSAKASKHINSKISLIFIDGSHEYKDVKNDFILWWQKLEIGGIIMFHDTLSKKGVSKFVDEIILQRGDIGTPKILHEITYFQKINNDPENIKKNKFFIAQKEKAKNQLERLKGLKL